MQKTATSGFPSTYATYSPDELIAAFEAGPARLRESIAGLDDGAMTARPRPGKWSIKEIVPHVADSEIQAAFRIRLTWAQPDSVWPVYDQDVWAKAHAYQDLTKRGLEDALDLFASLRKVTTPLFRSASADDWAKRGTHPELGPMTLRNLLELYADHSERHIAQILTIRELVGHPLDLPLLLPDRLL